MARFGKSRFGTERWGVSGIGAVGIVTGPSVSFDFAFSLEYFPIACVVTSTIAAGAPIATISAQMPIAFIGVDRLTAALDPSPTETAV